MSDEEKDALVGRLYREKKSLTDEIRLLTARARELGDMLTRLGQSLKDNPHVTRFEGQSFDPNMVPMRSPTYSMNGLTEAELRQLTETLREKMGRLSDVERDLG